MRSPWIIRHVLVPDTWVFEGNPVYRKRLARNSVDTAARPLGRGRVLIRKTDFALSAVMFMPYESSQACVR